MQGGKGIRKCSEEGQAKPSVGRTKRRTRGTTRFKTSFNFNLRPTAVTHRKEETIAGNPALQGYYLTKFPALLFFVKLRTQKGNFFKPTWKEIPQKNGWTCNRPIPIGTSIRNYFADHHIYTNLEPTSN